MAKTLIFKCPHCGNHLEVVRELGEQQVVCPKCQQPFALELPRGQLVGAHEADERPSGPDGETVDKADGAERTLKVVHPSTLRKHPLRYLLYVVMIVGGLGLGALLASAGQIPLMGVCLGVALLGAVLLGYWYFHVRQVTLTVTSRRTLLETGYIARKTSEVRHEHVHNVQIDQTAMERLMGVGDIGISSAGQDDMEIVIEGIPDPESIAKLVRRSQR